MRWIKTASVTVKPSNKKISSHTSSPNSSSLPPEKNYNILFTLIIFPFLRMHRSEPLTVEQIAELRNEVNKLL